LWVLATVIIGIYALSSAVVFIGPVRYGWLLRPAFCLAGFLLVDPGRITDLIGFGLLGFVFLFSRRAQKNEKAPAAEIQV
jgi:TRAP-type uncharacterized transport system fused permease subunit